MARFRQNHRGRGRRRRSSPIRMILMIGVTCLVLFLLWQRTSNIQFPVPETKEIDRALYRGVEFRNYLPASTAGEVIHHQFFSLAYSEDDEQAEWVAYRLNRDMLNSPKVPRTDWFERDPAVMSGSATYEDYRGSPYTRGHLVPAADMAFDRQAMEESFLMSNISPQVSAFNQGIWRELEEQVRDWARRNRELYIVTGPVLTSKRLDKVGRSEVSVPSQFYKVLLDVTEPEQKGIAFIIPNVLSNRPIMEYAVTIDSVEAITGIDFFAEMDVEYLEATYNPGLWPVHPHRYRWRVEDWNRK